MTTMTIGEIKGQMERGELTVNHDYQRSPQIWPTFAKSYFIDTILAGFPFPKIYIYAHYDDDLDREAPIRKEIVDGQQRVQTMMEYLNNEFYVSTPRSKFRRKKYRDLDQQDRQQYVNTMVEIDLILQADQGDVLEMFRRMNSYMAPLKPAEKRHADFNGDFKWFINVLSDEYSPLMRSYGVLTAKQIVRMNDAELLTELAQVLDIGIVDKSNRALEKIYRDYDNDFAQEATFEARIDEFFAELKTTFKPLARTPLMKTYNMYSLFCAMVGKKYGFPDSKEVGIAKRGKFYRSAKKAADTLKDLATALEQQDEEGPFAEYFAHTEAETTRVATRIPRAVLLAKYLDL